MKVKVTSYKKMESGKIKGFGDIEIDIDGIPLTIKGMKVVESQNNGFFYAFPDKQYTDKEDNQKYVSTCGIYSKEGYKRFHEALNSAFKEYLNRPQEQSHQMSQPQSQQFTNAQPLQSQPAFQSQSQFDDGVPF